MADNATKEKHESQKKEWEAKQAQLRAEQNLSDPNAVPEQRPIAGQRTDDPYFQSPTYNALKEEDSPLVNNEPMGYVDYQRAQSDSSAKSAEKESVFPNLLEGQRVRITREGAHFGKPAVVLTVNYADLNARALHQQGRPESSYAEVGSYTVRTRDSRNDVLELEPDEVEVVKESEFQRGGD